MSFAKALNPGSGGGSDLIKVKDLFFDRAAVMSAMDKAVIKNLNKFGGYVRKAAQNSLVHKGGYSKPGHAPHSHTDLIKKNIFYYADIGKQSVIIGPVKLGKKYSDVLPILEYGGATIRRGKPAIYAARPFMQPAFERSKTRKALKDIWQNSVKKGV
jgi:hypothetical protein